MILSTTFTSCFWLLGAKALPPDPYLGFAPGPYWGTSIPRPFYPQPLTPGDVTVLLLICLVLVCIAVVYLPMGEKQVTTIVIGAGSRGSNYANYALDFPQKFKVISHHALGL